MEAEHLKRAVRGAGRGDREAAGLLFDEYHPRVYRYALARLGNPVDAEDVAAEAFARVLAELDRFKWKGAGFEAWLFRIAYNLVIDRFRASGREQVGGVTPQVDTPHDETPETEMLRGELRTELGTMLNELADDHKEVLLLRFAAGLNTREVAAVMKRKPNAVRQLQFRALNSLREKMGVQTR